jgi:hypothetical protein
MYLYKIYHKNDKNQPIYIGSTINFLSRITKHKYCILNRSDELPCYKYIVENGGLNFWDFKIIEKYEKISRDELYNIERNYIIRYKGKLLNSNIPKEIIKFKKIKTTIEVDKLTQRTLKKKASILLNISMNSNNGDDQLLLKRKALSLLNF